MKRREFHLLYVLPVWDSDKKMKISKIKEYKRRIVQIISLLLINGNFRTLQTGLLYRGSLKKICIPVLNCHSCPFALTACPVGMIQQFLALGLKRGLAGALYILGLIGIPAVFLGRFLCGWVCPFGFLQELLHQRKSKIKFPENLNFIKYILLFGFVFLFPFIFMKRSGIGAPGFCKYICPAGTFEAGIWGLLQGFGKISPALILKIIILTSVIFFSMRIFRFFCRLCPLGLLLGFFNKVSFLQLRKGRVCKNCESCKKICPMDIDLPSNLTSVNCIRCLKCVRVCPTSALKLSFLPEKPETPV